MIGKRHSCALRALLRRAAAGIAAAAMTPAFAMVGGAPPAGEELARSVVLIAGSAGTACTATIVAPNLLLTVAHCVLSGADYALVETRGRRLEPLRDIVAVARHPQFDLKKLFGHLANADVALLKLGAPLPEKFTPAALAPTPVAAPGAAEASFLVAGYGVSVRGEPSTLGTLRAARLVGSGDPAGRQLRLVDPRGRGERAGLGACTSDSGAPVFRDDDLRALVGVVSWSTGPKLRAGCGGLTGVTLIAPYRAWIAETARRLGAPLDR